MQLRAPNTKALTILIIGLSSLVLWYALHTTEADTSWQTLVQKLALLAAGGVFTILGLNLTWASMRKPSDKD